MTEKSSKTNKKQPSFEESLDELDVIIHKMESRDLGLTESLAAYEKGVSLLRHLHEELSDIEQRVVTLVRIDEDGTPVFENATSTAESETVSSRPTTKGKTRKATRKRQKTSTDQQGPRHQLPGMDDPTAET
ncbi:MAG: exodeoxyribonuclease VII small subunit [Pirellulales bacterium]|nr:exodeoxyribonuclease VII small subunit [Pirellulales bacterium]